MAHFGSSVWHHFCSRMHFKTIFHIFGLDFASGGYGNIAFRALPIQLISNTLTPLIAAGSLQKSLKPFAFFAYGPLWRMSHFVMFAMLLLSFCEKQKR